MCQGAGIFLTLAAIVFLSSQKPGESPVSAYGWLIMSVLVFIRWGIQSFVMKSTNRVMKAEAIFFNMALSGVLLILFALWMTNFSLPIYWGINGPWLAASIHILNIIGALILVYAVRYGKAIVVIPLTGLSPEVTVILSLVVVCGHSRCNAHHRTVPFDDCHSADLGIRRLQG